MEYGKLKDIFTTRTIQLCDEKVMNYNVQDVEMRKIIFAEDNNNLSDALLIYFSKRGYDVTVVTSNKNLVEYIKNHPEESQVFVLDRYLEDGEADGIFQAISRLSLSRFLILTAHPSFESSVSALKMKARNYLVKPVSLGDLEASVLELYKEIENQATTRQYELQDWTVLNRSKLTRSEFVLLALARCIKLEIIPSTTNMATMVGFSVPTVHRGLMDLKKSGLVESKKDSVDKRILRYSITSNGSANIFKIINSIENKNI